MMAPKSLHIILASLSLLAVALPIFARLRAGGFFPIADLNAPEIVNIAKFAVSEINKHGRASLVFVSVVKGEIQVVSGMNYRLQISAKDGSAAAPETYSATVYTDFLGRPKLNSFEKIKV